MIGEFARVSSLPQSTYISFWGPFFSWTKSAADVMNCNEASKLADKSFAIQQDFGLEGYAYCSREGNEGTLWPMPAIR
jgi:lysozyme family protein